MLQKRNEGIESLTMMLMQRDSVVLGLVVLISVSASFPHGSSHQDTGHAHYEDMFKSPDANSDVLCNKLRRYIDIILRSALPNCEGFVPQVAGIIVIGKYFIFFIFEFR